MRKAVVSILFLGLIATMGCKSKERGVDPGEQDGGSGGGLPILILGAPAEHWVLLDTTLAGSQKSYGNVYVSTVRRAMYNAQFGFLIEGDLPDGCSTLASMELTFDAEWVQLRARSLRDPSAMCTQALVPFSYFKAVEDEPAFEVARRWKFEDSTGTIE